MNAQLCDCCRFLECVADIHFIVDIRNKKAAVYLSIRCSHLIWHLGTVAIANLSVILLYLFYYNILKNLMFMSIFFGYDCKFSHVQNSDRRKYSITVNQFSNKLRPRFPNLIEKNGSYQEYSDIARLFGFVIYRYRILLLFVCSIYNSVRASLRTGYY